MDGSSSYDRFWRQLQVIPSFCRAASCHAFVSGSWLPGTPPNGTSIVQTGHLAVVVGIVSVERLGAIRIRFTTFAFARIKQLNGDMRTVLYRVAQEALTNVARHAQASRAEVTIQQLEDTICMEIRDNGKGFPVEHMLHAKKSARLGLLGMRERLEMVGGSITVESAPGKGTLIRAQIPFSSSRCQIAS
ncbi:MAG TPA: ATP-binding protein [Verrucomicrobiae bacterium]|nr:ATP-binding protein [Verrucomicrobiae bacterium]